MAQIQFLGAAGTVTGSKFLVDTGKVRFLVDCGMFQGAKKLRLRNWEPPPVEASSIDHIFLTHAHVDHIGMLPLFVREGFRGPVWATPVTSELAGITLADSAHLQEEDARFANKKGFSKHKPALPLYTVQDAERAVLQLRPMEYGKPVVLQDGTRVQFRDAGHILGSATVEARIESGAERICVVFSGDLGRANTLILRDPAPIEETDYLLIESTYGNRRHLVEETSQELADIINEAVRSGGMLVVPAFALGRTQTMLYIIRSLKEENKIPDVPIFVDSPMAIAVTELFCRHIDEFDYEAREVYRATGKCPILCPNLHFCRTPQESKNLNDMRYPSVIISASGMATGGRILHHLKYRLPDPRNTILFVGFQSNGTRGQLLKDGAREIKIHGEFVPVRARIRSMQSFSRHADSDEILQWLRGFRRPPIRTFVVHGEPAASAAVAESIQRNLGWSTHVPGYLEAAELTPPPLQHDA